MSIPNGYVDCFNSNNVRVAGAYLAADGTFTFQLPSNLPVGSNGPFTVKYTPTDGVHNSGSAAPFTETVNPLLHDVNVTATPEPNPTIAGTPAVVTGSVTER